MAAVLTRLRAVLVAVLIAGLWACPLAVAQTRDPSGTYVVSGTAPNGQAYGPGTVAVRRQDQRFEVVWQIGTDAYAGIGLMVGDQLSVAIIDRTGSTLFIAVYRPTGQGDWQGAWAGTPGAGVGIEVWQVRR
ncbi:MAG: hypothetical protein EAZ99_16410 [Alphaproteobacteria bacterium]|nr:hypothetical protein [Alphaproteobacteria bacterium]TAD87724.1 MAG: hypothetical protein EAZ99_16410 [Alphaproteobacteria bacterium]